MGGAIRKLSGATSAKNESRRGAGQQLELSKKAQAQARADLIGQFKPSFGNLNRGIATAERILGEAQTGIEGALTGAATGAEGAITGGLDTARGDIGLATDEAQSQLRGFADIGESAAQQEAALSGVLGNEAQQAAFASFNESPGQTFLREQGEKAALRGAASQGRSLGGGVLAELQRRGTGLAQQDFGSQLARLSSIAGRGQQAGGDIANILTGRGSSLANLSFQGGQNIADIRSGLGGQLAGVRSGLASNLANLKTSKAQQKIALRSALGSGLANITTGQAAQQANIIGNRTSNIGGAALAGGQFTSELMGNLFGAAAKGASGGGPS